MFDGATLVCFIVPPSWGFVLLLHVLVHGCAVDA